METDSSEATRQTLARILQKIFARGWRVYELPPRNPEISGEEKVDERLVTMLEQDELGPVRELRDGIEYATFPSADDPHDGYNVGNALAKLLREGRSLPVFLHGNEPVSLWRFTVQKQGVLFSGEGVTSPGTAYTIPYRRLEKDLDSLLSWQPDA